MEGESEWWSGPLCVWLRSCVDSVELHPLPSAAVKTPISYVDLCNAAILNALLIYIDPRPTNQEVTPCDRSDVGGRLKNLGTLMRNIQSFYQEVLEQLIVMPLPDLLTIARHPFPEGSGVEMKKVLLLLLGCAVQSEKKEEFVDKIKQLELSLQHAIVEQIQKVTQNAECVLNVQALELDPDDPATTTVLCQLQRVVKERDSYAKTVLELSQEQESDSSSGASLCNGDHCARKLPESQQHDRALSPTTSNDRLSIELAETKAKLRKVRNDLEEKTEVVGELREDVEGKEMEIVRLQQERMDLMREARTVKDLRDELDCLQHKIAKTDRLEVDNGKLREKLAELEFFRSRVEELRQENHILLETRQVLEEQVDSWKRRAQQQSETEGKILDSQRSIHQLQSQLRQERDKLADTLDDNAKLEKELRLGKEKTAALEKEIEHIRDPATPRANLSSLGDQLNDSVHSRVLELELENKKLKSKLEGSELSGTELDTPETDSLYQALLNENENLRKKIASLKEQQMKSSGLCVDLQGEKEEWMKKRRDMEQHYSQLEKDYQAEVEELRTRNTNILNSLEDARKKFSEFKAERQKEADDENERRMDRMKTEMEEMRVKNTDLEKETKNINKEMEKLRKEAKDTESKNLEFEEEKINISNKLHAVDRENRCLQREKSVLKEKLDLADEEFETARSRLVEFEREHQRLGNLETRLENAQSQVGEAEVEKRHLVGQLEVEEKKINRLSEDLIVEKMKCSDLITKIQSVAGALGLGHVSPNESDTFTYIDTRMIEKWQQAQRQLSGLKAEFTQQETSARELKSELERTKKQLQHAQKHEETSSKQLEKESVVGVGRLRDLEQENRNVKEQVGILQERIRRLQAQLQAKENDTTAARQELTDLKIQMASHQALQTENAKLQVTMRNSELQEDLLKQDNEELQKQVSQLDQQNNSIRRDFERLQKLYTEHLCDHEQLQKLHEQLSLDYEALKRQINELKIKYKEKKQRDQDADGVKNELERERRLAADMKSRLAEEQSKMEKELRNFALLQNDHSELKKNHESLLCTSEVLKQDLESYQREQRTTRNDKHTTQLRISDLEGQVADLKELLSRKDMEIVKMMHKCDMMTQLNGTLEEESRGLMRQMDSLISQNQELLQQTLMDKEHYHAEEKELHEKMHNLKRHKEKLEEKIMAQIRLMDNSPHRKKEKDSSFVKRAAKALLPKSSSRKLSRGHLNASSTEDNSSIQSQDDVNYGVPESPLVGNIRNGSGYTSSPGEVSRNRIQMGFTNMSRPRASSTEELERNILTDPSLRKYTRSSTENLHGIGVGGKSSNSTGPESSLSSGTGGSSNGSRHNASPGRISWNGSERGVDVPCMSSSAPIGPRTRPPHPPSAHSMSTSSPHPTFHPSNGAFPRSAPPPLQHPPPNGHPNSLHNIHLSPLVNSRKPPPLPPARGERGKRNPPPPYPASKPPRPTSSASTALSSLNNTSSTTPQSHPPPPPPSRNSSGRPPPPPYPGMRKQSPRSVNSPGGSSFHPPSSFNPLTTSASSNYSNIEELILPNRSQSLRVNGMNGHGSGRAYGNDGPIGRGCSTDPLDMLPPPMASSSAASSTTDLFTPLKSSTPKQENFPGPFIGNGSVRHISAPDRRTSETFSGHSGSGRSGSSGGYDGKSNAMPGNNREDGHNRATSFHPGNNSLASTSAESAAPNSAPTNFNSKFPVDSSVPGSTSSHMVNGHYMNLQQLNGNSSTAVAGELEIDGNELVIRKRMLTADTKAERRKIASLYENLENLSPDGSGSQESQHETLLADGYGTAEEMTADGADNNKSRDSTIWYEYGCV